MADRRRRPSNDRPWPQGKAFYHFDKIYDRYQVGYHGPTFTYASMPDQYIFSALQRLELSKTHRKPLFARVDTVSSHMPWNRIPRSRLESGRKRLDLQPDSDDPRDGGVLEQPAARTGGVRQSIVYSLNTLTSFVQHYGNSTSC